jgi:hypothetical protein
VNGGGTQELRHAAMSLCKNLRPPRRSGPTTLKGKYGFVALYRERAFYRPDRNVIGPRNWRASIVFV